jgi:hypothetical protein
MESSMRREFLSYYSPSADDLEKLWSESVVVLDTNVLLDLYRVPEATREKILDMLSRWKNQIWIPYHVGLEFHGRRLQVIASAHKESCKIIDNIRSNFDRFKATVEEMKLHERGHPEIARRLEDAQKIQEEILEKAKGSLAGQLAPGAQDEILPKIDELFSGRVGEPPAGPEVLSSIYTEGAKRYSAKMGPGFEDADKEKSERPKFMAGGLTYEIKYGDLVIWKQMISHAKTVGAENVLFITKDEKEDWWLTINKDRVGPLPELREEMRLQGGVNRFWMYTLNEAIELYGKRGGIEVTQAIEDVSNLAQPSFDSWAEYLRNVVTDEARWGDVLPYDVTSQLMAAVKQLDLKVLTLTTSMVGGIFRENTSAGAILIAGDCISSVKAVDLRRATRLVRRQLDLGEVLMFVLISDKNDMEKLEAIERAALDLRKGAGPGGPDRVLVGSFDSGHFETYKSLKDDYGSAG